MAFQYNFKPNPKIADLYNSLIPASGGVPAALASSPTTFAPTTRALPNGQGAYQSPVVAQPQAPTPPPKQQLFPAKQQSAPPVSPAGVPLVPPQPAPSQAAGSQYTNPATGKQYTPQEYADSIAQKITQRNGQGDVPNYAGDTLTQGPQSAEQLQTTAVHLNNARNDVATGATDPYKVGSQSGVNYTAQELKAIENAYAGVYDPALDSAVTKLATKQKQDAADLASKNEFAKLAVQHKYDLETKQTPTYSDLHPNSASTAGLSGLTLDNFMTTTSKGNKYIDTSTVTDKTQKAIIENSARASGVPVLTDANVAKMNAIEDTRNNLDNISAQFDKVGYKDGFTKAMGGFGLTNRVADLFGNTDIGSFKAWRTAAINSIQALAGGVGSGLRINQAEINAAMQNDIPNESDTVAVGDAKLKVLKSQLDSWERTLLNQNSSSSSANTSANTSNNDPLGIR